MKEIIVFITIDSLRYDKLTIYGYPKLLTPFMDWLSRRAIHFTNFYANSIPTFFAFPVIFTGLPPFWRGNKLGISKKSSWVNELKKRNYYTLAFVAENFALYDLYNYADGFDEFHIVGNFYNNRNLHQNHTIATMLKKYAKKVVGKRLYNKLVKIKDKLKIIRGSYYNEIYEDLMKSSAENLVLRVTDKLKHLKKQEKVFIWLHLMDSHFPYYSGIKGFCTTNGYEIKEGKLLEYGSKICTIANKYNHILPEIINQKEKESIMFAEELYDSSIKYIDKWLEVLFDKISRIEGRKIFMITSDHGEAFGEKRRIYHEPFSLYNDVLKVPLIIYDSHQQKEIAIKELCSHIDIKKILFRIIDHKKILLSSAFIISEIPFGAKAPHFRIRNTNESFGNFPFMYSIIFKDGIKVILNFDGTTEIYDTNKYPFEQNKLDSKNHNSYILASKAIIQDHNKKKLKLNAALLKTKKILIGKHQ